MQTNHALVWIDHRSAHVVHFDREIDEVTTVTSKHGNEHLHHKSMAVGDGNSKSHPDFFIDVISAIGESAEILVVGPADAKTEFQKYTECHHPEMAKRIVKVEPMDRATPGQLTDYARHFFAMPKTRLGPHHHA